MRNKIVLIKTAPEKILQGHWYHRPWLGLGVLASFLMNHGINCEIIDLHNVSDIDHSLIYKSVSKTGHLIIADTGWVPYGVCAEVCRGIVQTDPSVLKKPVVQLGMQHAPCPTSHALEDLFYPEMDALVDAIYGLSSGKTNHGLELPSKEFQKSQKKQFKGPF